MVRWLEKYDLTHGMSPVTACLRTSSTGKVDGGNALPRTNGASLLLLLKEGTMRGEGKGRTIHKAPSRKERTGVGEDNDEQGWKGPLGCQRSFQPIHLPTCKKREGEGDEKIYIYGRCPRVSIYSLSLSSPDHLKTLTFMLTGLHQRRTRSVKRGGK